MMNVATSQIVSASRIVAVNGLSDGVLNVAHRLVEQYLGIDKPISVVTATYRITDPLEPLAVADDYPINHLNNASDGATSQSLVVTNDDKHIWLGGVGARWPATVVVQYEGGIERVVYDAIIRQAHVMKDRENVSPERTEYTVPGGGSVQDRWQPKYRTSISSDVRGMLFAFKQHGF